MADVCGQLIEWIRKFPLDKKIVIAAGYAEGHQILEQVCRRYDPVLNTDVHTIQGLVQERTRLALAKRGWTAVSAADTYWVIYNVLEQAVREQPGFIAEEQLTPGLIRVIHEAVLELRLAGVGSLELEEAHFENAAKGRFVKHVMERYERLLADRGWADYAVQVSLLPEAPVESVILLTEEGTLATRLDKDAFAKIGGDRGIVMKAGLPLTDPHSGFPVDSSRMFQANGVLAEAREAFRRMAEMNLSWDQTEVVISDYAGAVSAVHAAAEQLGIACTFAEGLPIHFSQVGQAVLHLLRWLESGYNTEHLIEAVRGGNLGFWNDGVMSAAAIRLLEDSGIGWGRDRYKLLDRLANPTDEDGTAIVDGVVRAGSGSKTVNGRRTVLSDEEFEETRIDDEINDDDLDSVEIDKNESDQADGVGSADQAEHLNRQEDVWEQMRGAAAAWRTFVNICFDALPDEEQVTPEQVLRALCRLLEKYARTSFPEERLILTQLQDLHRSASRVSLNGMTLASAVRVVRERVEGLIFAADGIPREGAVFVSSLQTGGQSGRSHTFIQGMNETVWRVVPNQDPILLDEERARISHALPLSVETAEARYAERLSRFGLIRGSCTMSFNAYDMAERREQYPAYELLQLFRLQSALQDADYETMLEHAGGLIGYASAAGRPSMDGDDSWMQRLVTANGQIRDGASLLLGHYGDLLQGSKATLARGRYDITEYDGMVDTSTHEIEFTVGSGKALSASKLELYARCPLQYFYQEVLKVRVKETAQFDRTQWLDAMERGKLLHEIFERYYAPWTESQEENDVAHDRGRLDRIAEETLQAYAERIPAPSPHVREKETVSIRRDVEIFYRQEVDRTSRPVYLELQLHSEDKPFELVLSEDLTLPIRGFVDRVDRIAPHQYRIMDYKSGKPSKYKDQDFFAGGTQLQHALYAEAVEQWLRRSGADPAAVVVESAYVFPTEKGMGNETVRTQNRKEDLVQLLQSLTESMSGGIYPPTRDPVICTYCNYAEVCGNHAEMMKEKYAVPTNAEMLRPLLEVHNYD